jgi:hypothetical protein
MITIGLCSIVSIVALTSMAPDDDKPKNLKVLPKNITDRQLDGVMDEWAHSLGVKCNFCHAPTADGKHLDFPSDAKPEKTMARHMYKMMNKINQKYFDAKKDSLGMWQHTGVNCNTCHHGESHPEVKVPEGRRGPGGPPGGPGGPPPGGPGGPPPGAPQKQ